MFYLGAGTSGRLGVLDASECPPTYGVSPDLIQGIMAGGMSALLKAKEGAEDSLTLAQNDLTQLALCSKDSVIGIAASGRTPYVIGGLDFANSIGALTGSISCVKNAQLSYHSTYSIECIVGPEIITGSTRMKAGTAQKMILNMISTTLMIQYGKVYQNLMVDVQPTNDKLIDRSIRIISSASNIPFEDALYYYDLSDKNVKLAICMAITKQNKSICEIELLHHNSNVSKAINYLKGSINE